MEGLPEGFVEKVGTTLRAAKERFEKLEARVSQLERENRSLRAAIGELQMSASTTDYSKEGSYVQECPVCSGRGSWTRDKNDEHGRCMTCGGKGKVRI